MPVVELVLRGELEDSGAHRRRVCQWDVAGVAGDGLVAGVRSDHNQDENARREERIVTRAWQKKVQVCSRHAVSLK